MNEEIPLPPEDLQTFAGGGYLEVGDEFVHHLASVAALRPTSSLLDVGCGPGRLAHALDRNGYRGRYAGIDCHHPSIQFCRQEIATRRSNFQFHYANVINQLYNPHGHGPAQSYKFPFADESFGKVVAVSVFTHMQPQEVAQYLFECLRVLKRGGNFFASFFLMPEGRVSKDCPFKFDYPVGETAWTTDAAQPERVIAYDDNALTAAMHFVGYRSVKVYPGKWTGNQEGTSLQDLVVARRGN